MFDVKMEIDEKCIYVFFTIKIYSTQQEAEADDIMTIICIEFGFTVSNLDALANEKPDGTRTCNLQLLWYLFGIVYDRACGVITGLAQHTYLHNFVLPILSSDELNTTIAKINLERNGEPCTAN